MRFTETIGLLLLALQGSEATSCALPAGTSSYSVITSGDASIEPKNVYTGLLIGGEMTKNHNAWASVNGRSYVNTLSASKINWNGGGVTTGITLSDYINFSDFEYLAQHAVSSEANGFKVVVTTSGCTESDPCNTEDYRGSDGQGEDNGKTLVIFNTNEDVWLGKTSSGRQFGPTVIAPFSTVYVAGNAGYVDGTIVAKALETNNGPGNPSSGQLHGDTYTGPITCTAVAAQANSPAPTPAPTPDTTYKQIDQECKVTRQGNNYEAVDGWECDPNAVPAIDCGEIDDTNGNANTVYSGTCGLLECTGKANPDKVHPHDDEHNGTNRVTICHRTCSENNPWVRITIDKDAWGTTYLGDEANGTSGCGHKLQHDVKDECSNKGPLWEPWAPWYKDYLIMDHGDKMHNDDSLKDYWKIWEPACPSVRNDQNNGCCHEFDPPIDRGDGVYISNNCCGWEGSTTLEPTPAPTPQPTPSPTPAPTPKPTPSPTPSPTPAPTPSPTPAPVLATAETPDPTPAPTPAPNCPLMTNTGPTVCPTPDTVVALDTQGNPLPDGTDVIWDINFKDGPGGVPVVEFRVDNPFGENSDIYVEYHQQVGTHGAFDVDCEHYWNTPGCNPGADIIEAACIAPEGKKPFTVVRIFFVAGTAALGGGAANLAVPECCEENPNVNLDLAQYSIVEYTYQIMCGC